MKQKSVNNRSFQKTKQQYLQYFYKPSIKPSTSHLKLKRRNKGKQNKSVFSNHNYKDYHHISQNSRLLKRILNPKRDPMILDSIKFQVKTHKHKRKLKTANHINKSRQQQLEDFTKSDYLTHQQRKSMHQSYSQNLKVNQSVKSYQIDTPCEYKNSKSNHSHINDVLRTITKTASPKKNRNVKKQAQIKQKQFELKLQNQRMGKRIINTRSVISTIINSSFGKTSLKFQQKNGSSCHNFFDPKMNIIIGQKYRKINNGVKKEVMNSGSFQAVEQNQEPQLTVFQIYGVGPTILRLFNFDLNLNPKLKDDTVIALQLIKQNTSRNYFKTYQTQNDQKQKNSNSSKGFFRTHNLKNSFDQHKQQSYYFRSSQNKQTSNNGNTNTGTTNKMLTHPFTVKQMSIPGFNIKFAVNLATQGQYLPLRIWQYNGVQSKQIGIIDINVLPYLKKDISREICTFEQKVKNGQILSRKLYQGKIDKQQMRKSKKQDIVGNISLSFQVYSKKFRKRTEIRQNSTEN